MPIRARSGSGVSFLLWPNALAIEATLEQAHDIAREAGLHYVYIGNVSGHAYANTCCPECDQILIDGALIIDHTDSDIPILSGVSSLETLDDSIRSCGRPTALVFHGESI